MSQSPYLPCGVTDEMCDGHDPTCGTCQHKWSEHYEEDDEIDTLKNERVEYAEGLEYTSDGDVSHACDVMIGKDQCYCIGFS
jgi:hypothetical protein